jgi:hypothetical protein
MKSEPDILKSKRNRRLSLYVIYILFCEILSVIAISQVWDRLTAWLIKKNKRSTL